mmetsp:Transcript_52665/g.94539  ORF Transcript_52665/g.94539 Transcript_52665/m.94539 type:complete len:217 (-) Transcript_52665:511-1161(-)
MTSRIRHGRALTFLKLRDGLAGGLEIFQLPFVFSLSETLSVRTAPKIEISRCDHLMLESSGGTGERATQTLHQLVALLRANFSQASFLANLLIACALHSFLVAQMIPALNPCWRQPLDLVDRIPPPLRGFLADLCLPPRFHGITKLFQTHFSTPIIVDDIENGCELFIGKRWQCLQQSLFDLRPVQRAVSIDVDAHEHFSRIDVVVLAESRRFREN